MEPHPKFRSVIIKNIPFLNHNIINTEQILQLLLQDKSISSLEYEELCQQLKKSSKHGIRDLLICILGKSTEELSRFLEILKTTGNEPSAERIEKDLYHELQTKFKTDKTDLIYQTVPDFKVSETSTMEIVRVLSKHPALKSVWPSVVIALGLSEKSQSEILRCFNFNVEFELLLDLTLQTWCNEKRDKAMFNCLLRAIGQYAKHKKAAKALLDRVDFIRDEKAKSPLKSKWWTAEKYQVSTFRERNSDNRTFIKKIDEGLSKNPETATQVIALSGLPGVGKTTTAIGFAKEHKSKYDYIFWIDCNFMETSVRMLGRELRNTVDLESMTVPECTRICFDYLISFTCLWIFDNAESYERIGEFADLLAQKYNKFQMIIISSYKLLDIRFAHQDMRIQGFDEADAVNLIKENVKSLCDGKYRLIHHLCQLLGYFPLALQIAVTALNNQELSIMNYIDKIRTTDSIIHETFHDYSQSLYKSVIKQYDNLLHDSKIEENDRHSADSILSYIAYTTPYDIPMRFFEVMENKSNNGIAVLSEYNFVVIKKENNSVSINPLVQQAIRYKQKEIKNENLKRILNCNGFIDIKLIPFCFADRKMQKEYENIKSQLIQEIDLQKLFVENRIADASKLSRLRYDLNPSALSMYNHAICLLQNFEIWEAKVFLKCLYKRSFYSASGIFKCLQLLSLKDEQEQFSFGVLSPQDNIYREIVAGHLFLIHLSNEHTEKANKILKKSAAIFECAKSLIKTISKFLDSNPNCCFQFDGKTNLAYLKSSDEYGCSEFSYCYVGEKSISSKLHELRLEAVNIPYNFSQFISSTQIKKLKFTNMTFSLRGAFTFDAVHIKRCNRIINWEDSQWKIKILTLEDVPFVEETQMEITELIVFNSVVNVEILPQSIKKLRIQNSNVHTVVRCSPLTLRLKSCLDECGFISCTFVDKENRYLKHFDISPSLKTYATNLKKLILDCSDKSDNTKSTQLSINIECLTKISKIHLQACNLTLTPNVSIQPKELSLKKIKFLENEQHEKEDVVVNEFVRFDKMTKLTLEKTGVDMKGNLTIDEVSLESVRVVNWGNTHWKIRRLALINVPFVEKNNLEINEMIFEGNTIDISCMQEKSKLNLTVKNVCHIANDIHEEKFSFNELTIDDATFELKNCKEIKQENQEFINLLLKSSSVQKLSINKARLPIPLSCLKEIPSLHLRQCSILKETKDRINPKELTLIDVKIILKNRILPDETTYLVKKIVDFSKMQKMCLVGMGYDASKKDVYIPEIKLYGNESDYQKKRKNRSNFASFNFADGDMEKSVSIISAGLNQIELKKNERIELDYPPVNAIKDETIDLDGTINSDETKTLIIENDEQKEDFTVSEMGALEIKNILKHHPDLQDEWKIAVPLALGLSRKSTGELEKLEDVFGNLVFTTLKLWRKEKGKKASFNSFLAVIEKQTGNKLAYGS